MKIKYILLLYFSLTTNYTYYKYSCHGHIVHGHATGADPGDGSKGLFWICSDYTNGFNVIIIFDML